MKRLLCLAMTLFFLSSSCAEETIHTHKYKLFLRQDNTEYYTALCTTVGCTESFPVYPNEYVVSVTPQEEECTHLFRKSNTVSHISIESIGTYHHEYAQWYDCTCEYCGISFKAFESDEQYFPHTVKNWDNAHITGDYKHLYIGYCDMCGALQYDIIDCAEYEDGSCMRTSELSTQRCQQPSLK